MRFDTGNQAVADAVLAGTPGQAGRLPDLLGLRTTAVRPGTMTTAIDRRPALLNPFGYSAQCSTRSSHQAPGQPPTSSN